MHFNKTTVVNPITLSKAGGYSASATGDAAELKKDGINAVNWPTARESLVGNFGITKLAPDLIAYKWLRSDKSSIIDNSKKGARVLMEDMITHRPYLVGEAGGSLEIHHDEKYANKSIVDNVSKTIEFLKKMKDSSGNSVYDNSMIVVYGDHHSHSNHITNPDNPNDKNFGESRSMLFVKYPHTTTPKINIVENKVIYSGQINSIISDYFQKTTQQRIGFNYSKSLINSSMNADRFSPDREIPSIYRKKYFIYKYKPENISDKGNYSKYKLFKIKTYEFGESDDKIKTAFDAITKMKGLR
ncbi:MAG: hypothetical protein KAG14_02015 [Mycoplasmataceae bacterium]|nr:hypothetical protein [Mycoplasmataceae bacterium]